MTAAPILALVLATTAPAASDTMFRAVPPVQALRIATPVAVDGVLDEAPWQQARATTEFRQSDPNEGAEPSQRTEVRVLFDDDALYVGARLWDSQPDSIFARLARRDVEVRADMFALLLDPLLDRRSGYYFQVNAAGTMYDGTLSNDGRSDGSWDGVWESNVRRDDRGWTAEMRIPFSQMRYTGGAAPTWGIDFARTIQRRNEEVWLTFEPRNASGFVSRFVRLEGLRDLRAATTVELMPYVTSKGEFQRHASGDPFRDGTELSGDVGGDLRVNVGSRMTLNLTLNPDFGQVEVDPAVVNLSDVESFFEERRPFFVEGSQNFRFGNEGSNSYWNFNWPEPMFFYSRRIGRAPQGDVPDADWSHAPLGTTILGAAKLTGKLTPTLNFGTLHALTGREWVNLDDGGLRRDLEVEPLTYYGVARGLKELPERRHGLGAIASLVARRFDGGRLADQLNRTSGVVGFDGWTFLDRKKVWVVSGWSAVTHVQGTAARIAALQRNSLHYYQRPDARQVRYDPTRTSLTGFGSRYWLNKQQGRAILNAGLGFLTPSWDNNDIGFQHNSDVVNGHVATGYKWTEPTKHRKFQDIATAVFGSVDLSGEWTSAGAFVNGYTEFQNNWSWNYSTAFNPQTVSNRRTRGGPRMLNETGYEFSTSFDTDGKAKRFYYVNAYTYFQPTADSWQWSVRPGIELKPVSNLTLRVGPSWERTREDHQYVTAQADPTAIATYGNRYVFATLDQTTFAADVRLNVAFTPRLSLQLFAQPLVSSGDYQGFKELARPRSNAFVRYGTDGTDFDEANGWAFPRGRAAGDTIKIGERDFNVRSLRGNAVLRWEYRPGSTFFLVWTQTREDEDPVGDFRFRHSLSRLAATEPENIFLAKLTYYLVR